MEPAYADYDLVICRAGALTVAELAAVGLASILVPFPYAVDDHQTFNARFLSDNGAAILLPQSELTSERLAELLMGSRAGKIYRRWHGGHENWQSRKRPGGSGSVHRNDKSINLPARRIEKTNVVFSRQFPRRLKPKQWKLGMKHKVKHVHFVGIGGSGMSGIAEVLVNLGYKMSGSDLAESVITRRLKKLGATIHIGHARGHMASADAVVTSTAVKPDNPEVLAARERNVPVVPRAIMLAELLRLRQGIAIAGTHGKTTTTSLIASILAEAGMDPTFVIGGRLEAAGSHAKLGRGEFIVVEADESDASFLYLQPVLAVVTNIDADHMETYGHDFAKLKQSFVDFVQHLPFYGMAVLCVDDVEGAGDHARHYQTCHDIRIGGYCASPRHRHPSMMRDECAFVRSVGVNGRSRKLEIALNLPGLHNVQNALAAIAVCNEVGLPDAAIVRALAGFRGVDRRFQRYGEIALSSNVTAKRKFYANR